MLSRSILHHTIKIHPPKIHHSLFLHQTSIFPLPSSLCTLTSPNQDSAQHHHHHLKRLNHKDWLSPNEVLKIFRTLKDPETLLTALNKLSNRKDYKPNEPLYSLIITKLAQAKNFTSLDTLLAKIKAEKNCRLSDEFFYEVIKIYGNVGGLINKAIETLFDMPNYHVWPSVKTFSFVLNLLVSTKQFDVIHEVYIGATKLGVVIDACCLNILIKGLCEYGNVDSAFQVLDEFPKQNCRPNVRTFSTLMHGLCEHNRVEEAFGLLEKMEKEEGISPDTITFNILIMGVCKQGRVEEGMELLERIKLKGCSPNSGSYQQVLYGLLSAGKYVEGKEFMGRMICLGIRPSFVSYRLVISGLCNENLVEDACLVLKEMVQQGLVPKMGMWRRVVECMFEGGGSFDCVSYGEIIENC